MEKEYVPGHAKAATWKLAAVGVIAGIIFSQSVVATLGVILAVLGAFAVDQTTHLAQHHNEKAPTFLEQYMQDRSHVMKFGGYFVFFCGIAFAVMR